jgi:transposase
MPVPPDKPSDRLTRSHDPNRLSDAELVGDPLDGLAWLDAGSLEAMSPAKLSDLTGLATLDDIAVSQGRRGVQAPYYLRIRQRAGRPATWEARETHPLGGLKRLEFFTGVAAERPVIEAKLEVVRRLAKNRHKVWIADLPRDRIGAIKAVTFLDAYETHTLSQPESDPAKEKTRQDYRGSLRRLREIFSPCCLDELHGPAGAEHWLVETYGKAHAGSTRKRDLDLLKRVINKTLRRMGGVWPDFILTEQIPRGKRRKKPDIGRDLTLRILLGAAGGLWDAELGCFRTVIDPATGERLIEIEPNQRKRDALAPYVRAILLELVLLPRPHLLAQATFHDKEAPHIGDDGYYNFEPASHDPTDKHRGRVYLGEVIAALLRLWEMQSAQIGASTIIHKRDGTAYKRLNRKIWKDLLERLNIPHFSFYTWKTIGIETLKSAGMTVIEIAEYARITIETAQRHYKADDNAGTQPTCAAAMDRFLTGGEPLRVDRAAPPPRPRPPFSPPPLAKLGASLLDIGMAAGAPGAAPRIPAPAIPPSNVVSFPDRGCFAAAKEALGLDDSPGGAAIARALFAPPHAPARPLPQPPEATSAASAPAVGGGAEASPVTTFAVVAQDESRRRALGGITLREPRGPLSDDEWRVLRAELAPSTSATAAERLRAAIDGMIHLAITGESWRSLPTRYGHWNTVLTRFRRWQKTGKIAGLLAHLQDAPPTAEALATSLPQLLEGLMSLSARDKPSLRRIAIDRGAEAPEPLTDTEWTVVERFVAFRAPAQRVRFEGLLFLAATGLPYDELPARYGSGDAAFQLLRRMRDDAELQALRDGLPKADLEPRSRNRLIELADKAIRLAGPARNARAIA